MKTHERLESEVAHLFRHAGDNAARVQLEKIALDYYAQQHAAHAIEIAESEEKAQTQEILDGNNNESAQS